MPLIFRKFFSYWFSTRLSSKTNERHSTIMMISKIFHASIR